jgi:TetR/AcrR family transcriptional regulator, regulator of cefoperazone and chloramphenicol sensitivity
VERLRANIARKLEAAEYDVEFMGSLFEANRPILRYIARGLSEEWPGMARIFDQAASDTAAWLSSTWPQRFPVGSESARRHGAVLTAMTLGPTVLHGHVARWTGADPLDREHQHVISGATVEVILRLADFLETATGRSMRSALADYERRMTSGGEREGDEDTED